MINTTFIQNKYTKWYINIITNTDRTSPRILQLGQYYEKHHIIPKCLGGSNNKTNIIKLTAREHFICHLLLTKMVNNRKLIAKLTYALWQFTNKNTNNSDKRKTEINITSTRYEQLKIAMSKAYKGLESPLKGTKKSEETKQKMSDSWHNNRGPEYFEQLSQRTKGDNNPAKRPEVKAKISKSKTGQKWKDDPTRKENHKKRHTGAKRSKESKDRMKSAQQKNKTRSEKGKKNMRDWQQRHYILFGPDDFQKPLTSYELKQFCKENNLVYVGIYKTLKTKIPYKKKWQLEWFIDIEL